MAEESVEQRAKAMGWRPLEEFRGNPDNFVEADKFVEMAETSLPHLKGTLRVMERKMADQEGLIRQQVEEMTGLRQDMSEFVQFSRDAEKRAYEKAVRDLKAEQIAAKDAGDMPAFVAATEKLDDVIASHPAVTGKEKLPGDTAPAPAAKGPQDEYIAWMKAEPNAFEEFKASNDWYDSDPDMFAYANQMDQYLYNKHGFKLSRTERFKEMTALVKKKFPEHFGNTARKAGSPVEGDTGGSPGGNGKQSYNSLPPDAKAQCDKWSGKDGKGESGTIPGFKREDFLKSYRW